MVTNKDCGNIKNTIVRKFKKTFVHFFPCLLMTFSGGKKCEEKTKLIFPFMKMSIEADDYQVVNILEEVKYHVRITSFILELPGSQAQRHKKANKMERKKTRWRFLQVQTVFRFAGTLSWFRKSWNTILWLEDSEGELCLSANLFLSLPPSIHPSIHPSFQTEFWQQQCNVLLRDEECVQTFLDIGA